MGWRGFTNSKSRILKGNNVNQRGKKLPVTLIEILTKNLVQAVSNVSNVLLVKFLGFVE